jgi:hypothetical protein
VGEIVATQSTSISKWPGEAGTLTKIRAGGSFGTYRAYAAFAIPNRSTEVQYTLQENSAAAIAIAPSNEFDRAAWLRTLQTRSRRW